MFKNIGKGAEKLLKKVDNWIENGDKIAFQSENKGYIERATNIKNDATNQTNSITVEVEKLTAFFNNNGFNDFTINIDGTPTNLTTLHQNIINANKLVTNQWNHIQDGVHENKGNGELGDYSVQDKKIDKLKSSFDVLISHLNAFRYYKANIEANLKYKGVAEKMKQDTQQKFNTAKDQILSFKVCCGKNSRFIDENTLQELVQKIDEFGGENGKVNTAINDFAQLKFTDEPSTFDNKLSAMQLLDSSFNSYISIVSQQHGVYKEITQIMTSYNNQLLNNAKEIARQVFDNLKHAKEVLMVQMATGLNYTNENRIQASNYLTQLNNCSEQIKRNLDNMTEPQNYTPCFSNIQSAQLDFNVAFTGLSVVVNNINEQNVSNQNRDRLTIF